jgi:hypothetical protein
LPFLLFLVLTTFRFDYLVSQIPSTAEASARAVSPSLNLWRAMKELIGPAKIMVNLLSAKLAAQFILKKEAVLLKQSGFF